MSVSNTSGKKHINLEKFDKLKNFVITEIKSQLPNILIDVGSLQLDLNDALFNGNLDDILFNKSLQDMPLHINDPDIVYRAVAKWRIHYNI